MIVIVIFLLFIFSVDAYGQDVNYQEFQTVPLDDMLNAYCFVQDPLGMIWIGSNRGLYSYDGYVARRIMPPPEMLQYAGSIHSAILFDQERIWLGTESGVIIYNFMTDNYEKPPVDMPFDVRAMLWVKKTLWIGSTNGLFKYCKEEGALEKFENQALPHQTVYSLISDNDATVYIGTYDGLCRYHLSSGLLEKIELPEGDALKTNIFVNSLLYDSVRQVIWVGTEGSLFRYDPVLQVAQETGILSGNSIKSMAIDHYSRFLLGTDNGLYVLTGDDNWQYTLHDSRYEQSLFNNSVWNIFVDRSHNVWFGTTGGISLYHYNRAYRIVPVSQITGMGGGNSILAVNRDSQNNLWLGGTGGLIKIPDNNNPSQTNTVWYRVDNARFPISHNHVGDIFRDSEENLWIATNGSISRFEPQTNQWTQYIVVDSAHKFNANWALSLQEDSSGKLWIATWQGGIFVADREKLMQTKGNQVYVAQQHFSIDNGLASNNVQKIVIDGYGHLWALCKGLFKINPETGVAVEIPLYDDNNGKNSSLPTLMLCDKDGYIWVAAQNGVFVIEPKNSETSFIRFSIHDDSYISSMVERDNHIWFANSQGIIVLEKRTLNIKYFNLVDKNFSGGFFDNFSGNVYFGMRNGLAVFSGVFANITMTEPTLYLTSLYVNEKLYRPSNKSIRYVSSIELKHNQNNLTIDFSDFQFSTQLIQFVYKMAGIDNNWRIVEPGVNRLSYSLLPPGKYRLNISVLDINGIPSENKTEFIIIVRPPWYYSPVAKFIYSILFCGLIFWIIKHFRSKHRMKIERIKKEKSLELSKLKIDFFTNISHDLKTPLSLILAPVSKLISETKTSQLKKELKTIEQNALHLNKLINQVLSLQTVDENKQSPIRSTVEIVKFSRKVFDSWATGFSDKQIEARFATNIEKLQIDVDILMIESVLSNLLSNACKFTSAGGIVELALQYEVLHGLEISIADTGTGIEQNEIPYIFDRFFQSKTSREKGGTGIGLYLVKTYVELHDGSVTIHSVENQGTTVKVLLPVITNEAPENQVVDENKDQSLILVVDDNYQIVEFISQFLKNYYRVATAYDGKSGLELCLKIAPDLIISDVMMPGKINGLEMCRQIRKHVPFQTTPIILLTVKNEKEIERESVETGIECFFTKPFDIHLLLLRIRQLIDKHEKIEEKVRMEILATPEKPDVVSIDEKFLTKITKIIEDKIADPDFNVNALSAIAGVDTKQLYRKTKQLTNQTPVEYIRNIRIKKAAMLLSQKNFSVAEVMYLVGFSNHSYFSKCFQNEFGKTPKEFLKN